MLRVSVWNYKVHSQFEDPCFGENLSVSVQLSRYLFTFGLSWLHVRKCFVWI